jgi:type III secretion protein X
MPTTITSHLLDPSLGIQNVMDMPETGRLPSAKTIATNVMREAGLEELYRPQNARSETEALLIPDVGDGRMLAPEVFSNELTRIVQKCSSSTDPDIRAMVDQELIPLLQNSELLQIYQGLMIGG